MTSSELIRTIAKKTELPKEAVSLIISCLVQEIRTTVLSGERVRIKGLGLFLPKRIKPTLLFGGSRLSQSRIIIKFRPIRSIDMKEKFGVVLEDDEGMTKTGSIGSKCPKCGTTLKKEKHCDECGTEPFEKRPEELK